jgi:putative transcriptional regulator
VRNRLRVLRAEHEWSQARLAEELEVSRQTVNAIENGKYDPSLPLAFRIARLFGQPIEAIFFPDGVESDEDDAEPRGRALPDVSADWA